MRVLRRTVVRLCQQRRAGEALRLLELARKRRDLKSATPGFRVAYWRLLGMSLSAAGHVRRSAKAFRHMLYLMQTYEIPSSSEDWSPLAAGYRALWHQTGKACYYHSYLSFTRERTDRLQARILRRGRAKDPAAHNL